MDVSELRKGILRALDDARRQASVRQTAVDDARQAFSAFLPGTAVPLVRQAADVLRAEGQLYSVHTPADCVRLVSDSSPHTYLEVALETSGDSPQVVGRISLTRGRQGHVVEEIPVAPGKPLSALSEDDVTGFLLTAIPKLVLKR